MNEFDVLFGQKSNVRLTWSKAITQPTINKQCFVYYSEHDVERQVDEMLTLNYVLVHALRTVQSSTSAPAQINDAFADVHGNP